MNIEVTVAQTSCAVRGLSNVTMMWNPGSACDCVSAIGCTGVTWILFCRRATNSSTGTLFTSFAYNSKLVDNRFQSGPAEYFFLHAGQALVNFRRDHRLYKIRGTVGCSMSTSVCDV